MPATVLAKPLIPFAAAGAPAHNAPVDVIQNPLPPFLVAVEKFDPPVLVPVPKFPPVFVVQLLPFQVQAPPPLPPVAVVVSKEDVPPVVPPTPIAPPPPPPPPTVGK
jgi:hypothetical protein